MTTNKNADYQREFRERKRGNPRLNTYIDQPAKAALEKLASLYGLSQREVLERALAYVERVTLERFVSQEELEQYHEQTLKKDVISNDMLSN